MHVLLLWTFFTGQMAIGHAEFDSKKACEDAGKVFEDRLHNEYPAPIVKWVCRPKG